MSLASQLREDAEMREFVDATGDQYIMIRFRDGSISTWRRRVMWEAVAERGQKKALRAIAEPLAIEEQDGDTTYSFGTRIFQNRE